MDTEEKDKELRTSQETSPSEEVDDMQDVLDLLDGTLEEDEGGAAMDRIEEKLDSEEGEEDLIDLIEMVDEVPQDDRAQDIPLETLGGEPEEPLSLELETPAEEEILDLVDEVQAEPESTDEIIDLAGVVEDQDQGAQDEATLGYSDADFDLEASEDESRLSEDLGIKMPEAPLDVFVAEEPTEPSPVQEPMLGEALQPTDETLASIVAERLSDERIEEILTRVAKETMEKKAERVLLEAAQEAIAKGIEKLKQAL